MFKECTGPELTHPIRRQVGHSSLLDYGLVGKTERHNIRSPEAFFSNARIGPHHSLNSLYLLAGLVLSILLGGLLLLHPGGYIALEINRFVSMCVAELTERDLRGTSVGTALILTDWLPGVLPAIQEPTYYGLRLFHVAGLVAGFGSALLIDCYFMRYLYVKPLNQEALSLLNLGGKLVTIGLIALWISGLGFIVHYYTYDPIKMGNPKIWAKFCVVVVLTINGIYIHFVLKQLAEKRIGSTLLAGQSGISALALLFPGVLSASAWVFAMTLGMIPQLKFQSADRLLLAYLCLLLVGLAFAMLVHSGMAAREKPSKT